MVEEQPKILESSIEGENPIEGQNLHHGIGIFSQFNF